MKFTTVRKWGAGLVFAAALCIFAPQGIYAATSAEENDGVMGQSVYEETEEEDTLDLSGLSLKSSSRATTPSILGATSYSSYFLENTFTTKSAFTGTTYYHEKKYANTNILNGIDVSWWQSVTTTAGYHKVSALNWSKAAAAGIDFAIVRVGSRDTSAGTIYEDTCADSHIQGATSAGMKVGLYMFSQALTEKEAKEEANYVLNLISKYGWKVTMPIAMDVEPGANKRLTAGKLSKSKQTAVIQAFVDTIVAAGYEASVYSNYNWFTNYIKASSLKNCSLWYARYNNKTTSYYTTSQETSGHKAYSDVTWNYEFWQYGSSGKVSGYSGNLDMNFWYKSTTDRTVSKLKVSSTTASAVNLSWSGTGSVSGYKVYRYDESQDAYVYIGETTKKSYKDTNVTEGTSYKYKINCYWTSNGVESTSDYTDEVTAVTKPGTVSNLRVSGGTQSEVTYAWDKVSSASGYRIYKYNSSSESYEKVTDVGAEVTSYTVSGLASATDYDYKVKAYVKVDGTNVWGTASDECIYVTNPGAVTGLKATCKSASEITLKWTKTARVTGYRVYRLDTSTGSYKKIATIKSGSTVTYTDTGLSGATAYSYKVCAYYTGDDDKTYAGEYSDVVYMTTKPAKVTGLKLTTSSKTVKLTWGKVTGASGYEVYRYNSKTKKYELIKTVKSTSFKNTKLTKGTTYKYKVRAYCTYDGKTYYGSYSAVQKITSK